MPTPGINPFPFAYRPSFSSPFKTKWPMQQARGLSLHEYQSQNLMITYGAVVPLFGTAETPKDARMVANGLKTRSLIIKAQILAGGRGLGVFESGLKGGVQPCSTPDEAFTIASQMLGHKLVTKQTGPAGHKVTQVLIAKRYNIKREAYFAILLDRSYGGPVMVGSKMGGMDIEKAAHSTPDALVKLGVNLDTGPTPQQCREFVQALGFDKRDQMDQAQKQINGLFKLFREKDCTMLEVNPMIETTEGTVMCIDAKINFDDNAEFRQKAVFAQRDSSQNDPREVEARKWDLNYIALDGDIGCLVNGAGLAMATLDMITAFGGHPANFLDVGGGASQEQVTAAIRILCNDSKVKRIFVNIFGGIMRCDIIATGLISAAKELSLTIPLIVRLQGTNVKEANALIASSGLKNIFSTDDLEEAAKRAAAPL